MFFPLHVPPEERMIAVSIWRFASHSVVGTSHLSSGKPNQDRATCFSVKDLMIMIIADGAGTCKKAVDGAELVVKWCKEECGIWAVTAGASAGAALWNPDLETLVGDLFERLFAKIEDEIGIAAKAAGTDPEQFGTGACVALVAPYWLACRGIGDVACFRGSGDTWSLMNPIIKKGSAQTPAARNVTYLFPAAAGNRSQPWRSGVMEPGDMVILCSDGALSAFAQDIAPASIEGQYEPYLDGLRNFYGGLAPLLQPQSTASAQDWLANFVTELTTRQSDDTTIAAALSFQNAPVVT